MSSKKGDPVVPPPVKGEYKVRYGTSQAVSGWQDLGNEAPGNTAKAWQMMRTHPAPAQSTDRHHRLKYDLATVVFQNVRRDQWQIEVTTGGRVWYVVDEERKTVWLLYATAKHPKRTE